MANWKTPRSLESRLEIDRRKRPNQLYATHVSELNKFAERIRESKYGDRSVPWFDPAGAGVNARVLMLLQDPSETATKGTGFISPDNPDKTADNTTYFRNKANLHPDELIHWNIVPWAINGRTPSLEIDKAKPFLKELIHLLPKVEVVVCMGVFATDGWNQVYPQNLCKPGLLQLINYTYSSLISFTCPHPSTQSVDGKHALIDGLTAAERIEMTLVNTRRILDKYVGEGL
jgi:uracil-DNA glycosylase